MAKYVQMFIFEYGVDGHYGSTAVHKDELELDKQKYACLSVHICFYFTVFWMIPKLADLIVNR